MQVFKRYATLDNPSKKWATVLTDGDRLRSRKEIGAVGNGGAYYFLEGLSRASLQWLKKTSGSRSKSRKCVKE